MSPTRYYHGGTDALRVGDILAPGHGRKHHPGCPWCEARAQGEAHQGMDGPSQQDGVYLTEHRLYAKHYASLFGYGSLYRVEPLGDVMVSTEDSIPTVIAPAARVVAVLDRAVRLTNTERRRLFREWGAADQARAADTAHHEGSAA